MALRADDSEMHGATETAELPALGDIARRAVPNLLEATIVPALLFYGVLVQTGQGAAMLATLCWALGAIGLRLRAGERIPGLLLLSLAGLVLRTVAGLCTGSAEMYFLQPVVTTVAMAALFLGSVVVGRPLVATLASDFCPLSASITSRPAVRRLFRRLTVLWAGVHLATAAATTVLLFTLPLATFVAVKTVACLALTAAGAAVTVWAALRTVRSEGIVLAGRPAPALALPTPMAATLAAAA